MFRPPISLSLLSLLCSGCGSASTLFVSAPAIEGSSFVVSVLGREGRLDLSSATIFSNESPSTVPSSNTQEPTDELLWLVFDEAGLQGGLRARARIEDLARIHLRAPSGTDCGFGGNEVSLEPDAGSVVRQTLLRLGPRVFTLGPEERAFRERSLSDDFELGAYELELPANVEDCGLREPHTATPFTEGGVFDEDLSFGGETIGNDRYWYADIVSLGLLNSNQVVVGARAAVYVLERGRRLDLATDPVLHRSQLPLPAAPERNWELRSLLAEPKPGGPGDRMMLLYFSFVQDSDAPRHIAIIEVDLDGGVFGTPTTRFYGEDLGFPLSMVKDAFGGLTVIGISGLVLFAEHWDAPFVERRLGAEDLRAIAVSENFEYRHVISERGGTLHFGDLASGAALERRIGRNSVSATYLDVEDGAEAHRVFAGWRDGGLSMVDLASVEASVEFVLELPRRLGNCAGPASGACGRTLFSGEIAGLAVRPDMGASPQLHMLLNGCTHPILVEPFSGCAVALGEGTPNQDGALMRHLGTHENALWFGGANGQLFSMP